MRIVIVGGTGILGTEFKKIDSDLICLNSEYDIFEFEKLEKKLYEIKPDIIINCAAIKSQNVVLDPIKSINVNIIGSCNVSKYSIENGVRIVYISTDYVYPGTKGQYSEEDPVLPSNSYAWTKLAGEAPVKLVKNHLIIRTSFGSSKFDHENAYKNLYTSKDYVDIIAPKILKAAKSNYIGTLNIGTERKSIFDYANRRNIINGIEKSSDSDFSLNTTKFQNYVYES